MSLLDLSVFSLSAEGNEATVPENVGVVAGERTIVKLVMTSSTIKLSTTNGRFGGRFRHSASGQRLAASSSFWMYSPPSANFDAPLATSS